MLSLFSHPAVVSPRVTAGAPWDAWADRLSGVVAATCRNLRRRGRWARRVTVTLIDADGCRHHCSTVLPRATASQAEILPAALGLLRLLVGVHAPAQVRLIVGLGLLSRPGHRRGGLLTLLRRPALPPVKPGRLPGALPHPRPSTGAARGRWHLLPAR
ncbi:MAG: hypothetical protein VKQ33_05825 [Candidatus Sericytochromatia bacterium]|nr:hypothetical protein [Candidatus Sericytochromatia bacterium]